MGEDRRTFKIKDGSLGEVKIADEVVAGFQNVNSLL